MSGRYALYFAPTAGSVLAGFGDCWLGRAVESGEPLTQPAIEGFDGAATWLLTEAPRHYGFHGTLKPPFRLADGCEPRDLHQALERFASRHTGFDIGRLYLREIGNFIALVPDRPRPELSALADACVTEFDPFRAPPEAAELAKRRAAGLTPRQSELLARWGYPYVLDEFRFHLTLTGPVRDPAHRARAIGALAPLATPLLREPVPVREVCLFHQPNHPTVFRLIRRYPFGA